MYCLDGKRVTCRGGSTASDLAVKWLARHCGRIRALKGLADMLVDEARKRHVGRVISLTQNHLAEQKTMDDIAAMIGSSRRQLDRLFKSFFGQSPNRLSKQRA